MVAPDRNRLRRAFGGVRGRGDGPEPDGVPLREFLRRRAGRSRTHQRVRLPDGDVLATRHGPVWRREMRYPMAHAHGRVPLGLARALDGEHLAGLVRDESFADLRPEHCLFLDTETTGLSAGAGTVVFNYGFGFFRGDELVVEQVFLREFGEEPAVLHHIAARLWQFPVFVTYVGKSFDRHRIATRMALHGVRSPALTARHVDLYHVVRRRYAGRTAEEPWPNARLRTAEERLLGFRREDDLPGAEAPQAFFDWIRDGTGPVDRVLEHNRLDVLSLCALLGELAGRDRSGTSA